MKILLTNFQLSALQSNVEVHLSSGRSPPISCLPYSEVVERPVRKPRVKSLRLNRITLQEGSTSSLSEWEPSNQIPFSLSPTPIPLPRKGGKALPSSDVDSCVSSLPPPEVRTMAHPSRPPSRRIDDAALTSSRRRKVIDDSTYRVPKHNGSTSKLHNSPKNDVVRDVETVNDVITRQAGDVVTDENGWTQTWI